LITVSDFKYPDINPKNVMFVPQDDLDDDIVGDMPSPDEDQHTDDDFLWIKKKDHDNLPDYIAEPKPLEHSSPDLIPTMNDKSFQAVLLGFSCASSEDSDDSDSGSSPHRAYSLHGSIRYTPPELHLGMQATTKADIWAFGCLVFDLVTHGTLIGAGAKGHLLRAVTDMLGPMPKHMLEKWGDAGKHVDEDGNVLPEFLHVPRGVPLVHNLQKHHPDAMDDEHTDSFLDFLLAMVNWDPEKRWSAESLMGHEWIQKYVVDAKDSDTEDNDNKSDGGGSDKGNDSDKDD
jgi:serine/threonine protein kinase